MSLDSSGIQKPKKTKRIGKNFFHGISALGFFFVVVLILLGSFYTIETGEVGVLSKFGKYDFDEKQPGLHFKIPIVEDIKKVDVRVRTINYVSQPGRKALRGKEGVLYGAPINVLDQRGLNVMVELTVQYKLRPEMAAETLAKYGRNYEVKLIHPVVRDAVRDIIAQYPAEQIPLRRTEIARKISSAIIKTITNLKDNPLEISTIQLRNIALPPRIAQKIQEVQIAKQEAEKMKALQEKAEREQKVKLIQAETRKQEKIKAAEAENAKKILEAEADKKARILKAEGEAKANELLSKSITQNLLEWRRLDVEEKMADAIEANPNVRLFYRMGNTGNLHFWMNDNQPSKK